MNTRLLFAASVLPWLLLATAACSAQDSQVVEVQAEFLTDVTVEGEPLMLILKVATRTPDDALLEFGHFYEENVQAWITASNGTVYEKHVLRPGGFGSSGAAPLKAGSLWQHVYVLDEWFPPLPEGVYRLRMIVPEMARTNEGKTLRVGQPQELTFSIAARDSARLKV